ncbi:MAG: CotH kinase family protein [Verrucomicrobia bacterium]|nr:CotH kinase family protein [Verrucomicrobiota bacterium]
MMVGCLAALAGADDVWLGVPPGDGVSLYQEANWLDTATGVAPPAGAIDPKVEVNVPLLATNGTPGGPEGAGAHLWLGTGSLSVRGDAVLRMSQGGSAGIRVDGTDAGANRAFVDVSGAGQVFAQYFSKCLVTLGDSGMITLYGGGNPLNNAAVNLTSTHALLKFLAEPPANVAAEHLAKITVHGLAARTGLDVAVVEPGDNLAIVASGGGAEVRAVDYAPALLIEAFDVTPAQVFPGGTATLSWAVTPPFDAIAIAPEPGDVSAVTSEGAGSAPVAPPRTTAYTLTVSRGAVTDTATVVLVLAGPAEVRLNELMALNRQTLRDEDGDDSDWIELRNGGGTAADLGGWHLTDNPTNLNKWKFPEGVRLEPGGYVVVFASEKNRRVATNELHTNFKLSGGGEFLALVEPDGVRVADAFAPMFPALPADISYGSSLDGTQRVYFTLPTPRRPNGSGTTRLGPVIRDLAPTAPSPNRTPANGPLDDILVLAARVLPTRQPVDGVTLFCRFGFGSEVALPMTDDGTGADLQAADTLHTAAVPLAGLGEGEMIRWRVEARDLEGAVSRLPEGAGTPNTPEYAGTVTQLAAGVSQLPVFHWFVANPAAAGTRAGTRASVFYLEEFYDNVFVRVRGGTTASLNKKSYKFDFNPGCKFRFAADEGRVEEINLNTTYTDKAYSRVAVAFEAYDRAGAPGGVAFPLRVHQNGAFHSVAMFVEQPDGDLLEREGLDPEGALYKMFNAFTSGSSGVEKKTRRFEDNADLVSLVTQVNSLTGTPLEHYLFDHLNVPALVTHMAATVLTQNDDNMAKNYYLYRDTPGSGEWQMLPWDLDLTFGRHFMTDDSILGDTLWADHDYILGGAARNVPIAPSHPFVGTQPYPGNRSWNRLIHALLSVERIQTMFRRRLRTVMDEILQPPGTPPDRRLLEARFQDWVRRIGADADLDRAAWGQYGVPQTPSEAVAALSAAYLDRRRTHLFVTHLAANAAHYTATNSASALLPDAPIHTPPIGFGPMDFNPASGNQDEEFIQLTNPHPDSVDLSGWQLLGAVDHAFAPGTVLVPGGTLCLSPDVAAFRARSASPRGGEGHFVQGNYRGHLSARGESLVLRDAAGATNAALTYPGAPSLEQQHLRITELMFNPPPLDGSTNDAQEFEFIELGNMSSVHTLSLAGVQFVEGVQFRFSTGAVTTLAPGASVLVVENLRAFAERYGAALPVAGQYAGNLANDRERLCLADATGEHILDFDFEADWHKAADGRGHSLVAADPRAHHTAWDHKPGWLPSACPGGSPGADEPETPCDADADGLPDGWELDFAATLPVLGAGGDADGDGFSDTVEFGGDTDPVDPHHPPRLTVERAGIGEVTLRFPQRDGRVYVMERSADLTAWEPFSTNVATAGEIRLRVGSPNAASLFLRARWQP